MLSKLITMQKCSKVCSNLIHPLNPFALRKAKTVYNFGLSECNGIKCIMEFCGRGGQGGALFR